MAMASAPPVTPIPHCLDWRSFLEVVLVLSASKMRLVMTFSEPFANLDGSDCLGCGLFGGRWGGLVGGEGLGGV